MVSKPDALYAILANEIQYNQNWMTDPFDSRTSQSYLRDSFLKKLVSTSTEADDRAIHKFLQMNERCRYFWQSFGISKLAIDARNWLRSRFAALSQDYDISWDLVSEEANTGPGASVGSDSSDFLTKIALSKMSTTSPGLVKVYNILNSRLEPWSRTEEFRAELMGPPEIVQGSKLSCVPKNSQISRVICTEPLLNMLLQKGFAAGLDNILDRAYGINYRGSGCLQPDKNRELARIGSIDGSFATIDLSSASDCISLDLVKYILPPSWLGKILTTRSPFTTLPNGEVVELHMVSSMGNGFTFPLQTLIFTAILEYTYERLNIPLERPRGRSLGNYGVFGDDIICRTDAALLLLTTLESVGFLPNWEKTFIDGYFRESCGADYHSGNNVRPFFLRRLDTLQDSHVAFNRLVNWSVVNNTPLTRSLTYILSQVREQNRLFVPLHASDDEGFKIPWRYARRMPGVRLVFSKTTQSSTFSYYSSVPKKTTRRISELLDEAGSLISYFYQGTPISDYAVLLAALRGDVEDNKLSIRPFKVLYRRSRRYSPNWDYTVATRDTTTADLLRGGTSRFWIDLLDITLTT